MTMSVYYTAGINSRVIDLSSSQKLPVSISSIQGVYFRHVYMVTVDGECAQKALDMFGRKCKNDTVHFFGDDCKFLLANW